jgi:hypothetical protein
MTVLDSMSGRIMPMLQQIERDRQHHGNETCHWIDFVVALVFFFTKGCDSAADWARALDDADPALNLPKIPRSTLSSKFYDFDPNLLHQIINGLLMQIFPNNPDLALIGHLNAVDGSFFTVIGGIFNRTKREWSSQVKLHLNLNLNCMLPVDFISDYATSDERAAFLRMAERGVTYVVDRGYMAFYVLRQIIAREAFIVMRVYESVVFTTIESFPVTLPSHMHQQWTNVRDSLVRSNNKDAEGLVFRLVECTIGDVTYRLMTNRFDLTTYHILLIYAYRWQIELMFRFLKQTLGCKRVITQSPRGIETFFAGMLLTALLEAYFKVDCLALEGYVAPSMSQSMDDTANVTLPHDAALLSKEADCVRTVPANTPQPRTYRQTRPEYRQVSARKVQTSTDTERPTIKVDVAVFMDELNQKTALFWKIPKQWIETLRDCMYRPFTPEIVSKLNKRALVYICGP